MEVSCPFSPSTVAAAYSVTMPSLPPSVRPVLAALLTALLMASSVLVSTSATHAAPAAPSDPGEDAPVSMDLVSLTPTSLAPDGTLEAQVDVTNTSSAPLDALALELRTRTSRVTDRSLLADWQSETSPDTSGPALASSPEHAQLAPGESTVLTVRLDAEELGYSEEPYFWGTRRISLTVVAEEEPLTALRSFVVWRPDGADAAITQSVMLPLASEDASAVVTDPAAYEQSVTSGRLASIQQLAQREDVDWWLDPALLDPPQVPVGTEMDGPGSSAEDEQENPLGPVLQYEPAPLAAELADALEQSAAGRTVLGMPYAQSDTVSLRAAGAERLDDVVRARGEQAWQERGLEPHGQALRIEGSDVDAEALESVQEAGASTAILPSSSLRPDPAASITPSSIGVLETGQEGRAPLALLAPDPELSAEFSLLTAGSDTEQTRQRLLAETATIASEYATAPRHLLISPSPEAVLDPAATQAALDAMGEAPWIEQSSTSTLLEAAEDQRWTTDPRGGDGELYALGALDPSALRPSAPAENGRWEHLAEAEEMPLLPPEAITELDSAWEQVDTLSTVMEDDAPLEAPQIEILAGTSMRWRDDPQIPAQRAQEASLLATELQDRIDVVPASGYNVISDEVAVPITITNDLDTPITVRIEVTSDKPLVQIAEPMVVEVPARGQIDAGVDVEAIANGTVTLTTVLTTEDGRALTAPIDVPLTVNPSWENWTTLMLVIAMGLLVVVGVARARNTGSSSRAPAMRGPEDPVELSRSGRSTPDTARPQGPWEEHPRAAADTTEEDR